MSTMASSIGARVDRNSVTLPSLQLRQDGHNVYLTAIRAEDLDRFTTIDHYRADLEVDSPDQGYQRAEETSRVTKLGNWLRKTLEDGEPLLMPTAILASTRGSQVDFDQRSGCVTLRKDKKLQIVDGQHRKAGFRYAIHDRGVEALRDFQVPLVIVEGLTKEQEMIQFRTINGNQKGVRTDLVNMILTQLSSSRGDDSIPESDQWRVVVARTVEALQTESEGPWQDMIVMPNASRYSREDIKDDESLRHRRVVRATSFMSSLRPIYDYLNKTLFDVRNMSTSERSKELTAVVTAFWAAVKRLNPDSFAHADDYVVQKTPGLFALHIVCKRLLPVMHMARREWVENDFYEVLEPSAELKDPEFWSAETGEAGKYGSMKGFSELAELLWAGLETQTTLAEPKS